MIGALPARLQAACNEPSICAIMVGNRSFKEEMLDRTASAGRVCLTKGASLP
jgi:hypothetical protein